MGKNTTSTDRPLFRFAVLADTHVNPADGVSNSPWRSNRLANARTGHVVQRVNAEQPELVVHLGDMVHPVPGVPTYGDAAKRFWELVEKLDAPLHVVPGNHDAGDKPVEWAPAEPVTEDYLELYERTFAASHYSFDYGGCHFAVINTMIINSDLPAEQAQREWLERDLAEHEHERTFLFGHYPIYLAQLDEPECYDNVADPGRSWLLGLLERHGIEAYFAGHVHNFFYNQYGTTDCYLLPSTSFVRHDYSELSRVEPAPEFGRDDGDKLGYMVVDVYADDHVPHVVRSHGVTEKADAPARVLPHVHVRRDGSAPVGLDMRQAWSEVVSAPYNGMLDEFTRRSIRNDYPLLAMWEMGAGALRVPLHDLIDQATMERMRALVAVGHEFSVFSFDVPTGSGRRALADRTELVRRLEIVLPPHLVAARVDAVAELRRETGLPVHLSPLATSAHTAHGEEAVATFSHYVRHGFDTSGQITAPGFDGVVFRVPAERSAWQDIRAADQAVASLDMDATVHVALAGDAPAAEPFDDVTTANRVAETLLAAWCADQTQVFLDTFADVDRGYFPRLGLTDRRYNLRPAGTVFRNLHAALRLVGPVGRAGDCVDLPSARVCRVTGDVDRMLVLPGTEVHGSELEAVAETTNIDLVDLATGAVRENLKLADATCRTPTLIWPAR